MDNSSKTRSGLGVFAVICVVALLIIVFLVSSLWKTVQVGNYGIKINYNGKQTHIEVVNPGTRTFVNPFTEGFETYPRGQQTLSMLQNPKEGQTDAADSISCQDNTGVPFNIDMTVVWEVDENNVGKVYMARPNTPLTGHFGSDIQSLVVRRDVTNAVTTACGGYSISQLQQKQYKESLQSDILNLLTPTLAKVGIQVDAVAPGHTYPPKSFTDAAQNVAVAQQKAIASQYLVQTAQNQANADVIKATGVYSQTLLQGKGQADKIQLINKQLASSPIYVQYLWASNWNGVLPGTLVQGSGSSSLMIPAVGGSTQPTQGQTSQPAPAPTPVKKP